MNLHLKSNDDVAKGVVAEEGASVLQFLRNLECEDQKLAIAVLEGMKLQKKIETQRQAGKPKEV